jgi:hypothetical protein
MFDINPHLKAMRKTPMPDLDGTERGTLAASSFRYQQALTPFELPSPIRDHFSDNVSMLSRVMTVNTCLRAGFMNCRLMEGGTTGRILSTRPFRDEVFFCWLECVFLKFKEVLENVCSS